jgi:hypothetical protein
MHFTSDELAIVTAAISAVVSVISVCISYRAYKRDGVKIEAQITSRLSEREQSNYELAIQVINKGTASVQITEWEIQYIRHFGSWRKGDYITSGMVDGPRTPSTLQGFHSLRWMVAQVKICPWDKMRVIVRLGSGKFVKSNSLRGSSWLEAFRNPT